MSKKQSLFTITIRIHVKSGWEDSIMVLFASNNVLVPVDFSDEAKKALENTLEFIGDPQKIHVINVLPPLEPTEPGVVWKTVDNETRIERVKETFYEQ